MRVGMFMMPVHPPGRPMWSTPEADAEKLIVAGRLGFLFKCTDHAACNRMVVEAVGFIQ